MTIEKDYGCPTLIELIEKWTEGDKQNKTLLAGWFGSVITGIPLPDNTVIQVQNFLNNLRDRDPEAISTISTVLKEMKEYAKIPAGIEQIRDYKNERGF